MAMATETRKVVCDGAAIPRCKLGMVSPLTLQNHTTRQRSSGDPLGEARGSGVGLACLRPTLPKPMVGTDPGRGEATAAGVFAF